MKKITAILMISVLLFSCKKETGNVIHKQQDLAYGLPPLPTYNKIIIHSDIGASAFIGKTLHVTFKSSPIIATFTPDAIQTTKTNIVLQFGARSIGLASTEVKNANGLRDFKLMSASGLPYYSFSVDDSNVVTNFISSNNIPFDLLSTTLKPLIIVDANYAQCMKSIIHECGQSWFCSIAFGSTIFGVASAGIGWSMYCISH